MQILILGNGFDIEHKLPTQYKDFLRFAKEYLDLYKTEKLDLELKKVDDEARREFYKSLIIGDKKEIGKSLFDSLKTNKWIEYFLKNQTYIKENWIDFESEISKIVVLLEKAREAYQNEALFLTEQVAPSKAMNVFYKEMYSDKESRVTGISGIVFPNTKKLLLNDLNRMIKALEIYLAEFVGEIAIKNYNRNIADLNPTHIISFNYTNTYEKVYDNGCRNICYDFIHGQARKGNLEESNIVLGIDEYFDEDARTKNVEYIEFQKYYQRMQKKTECSYKEWTDKIIDECKNSKNKKVPLYIFGHSLDSTDKDILREFLLNENIETTIFYYDQNAYERGLANLVKVLGANELLKRMYGKEKSITFIKQDKSTVIENSEFDIKNDTMRLYRLDKFEDEEMIKLISKVREKIRNREKEYFCSQERIISLFDALSSWGLCNEGDETALFEMAKLLRNPNCVVFHNSEKWHEYDYRGDAGCPIATLKFLNKINSYNEEMNKTKEINLESATANEIISVYERRTDLDDNLFAEILDVVLVQMRDKNGVNLHEWKQLCQIAYNNMDIAKKVIREKISTEENDVKKIRLIDLYSCCEETEFFLAQERAYMESRAEFDDEE